MMLSVSIQPNTPYLQCARIAPSGYHEAARGRRKQTSFTTQFCAASHIAQIAKTALPVPHHMKDSFDPSGAKHSRAFAVRGAKLVTLTLCVWVGVLSTLLPICTILELNMFFMLRTYLDASLNQFSMMNLVFDFSQCPIRKFQTICSGSSWCSIALKIAQNSTSLIKSTCTFLLS